MIVEIHRIYESDATTGMIVVNNEILGLTMELPWYGNKKNVSCIPCGEYICKKHDSPTFGKVYKVCNVFGRSDILFHVANSVNDLKGCIGMGDSIGYEGDTRWVYNSRKTLDKFYRELDGVEEFKLIIK